ncbi:MAG: prenyltransferase [Candidatus Thiodiazotropha sp. (ex Lucina aurantia)]|nr:prenyltransferase [Candidatus Thiodiazotropha sp. (ex Lucina pensylvanica)]MBT3025042.1 prenyltransferase [Candidatus Thiodiazotropha taylori]MBT3040836.1 prenyltransferase [Candidatus Thiodiazotropha sp. (ex Codakia orbicularis)]MBV2103899.1 prenyltransferase [Candidatus Thiodiazotropha sp. (ex Lucina aurantia)]MBV2098785.1 prenyltransferase [Candidatus Thiodiazotropha sp. (ex Codakia orbicularis)]
MIPFPVIGVARPNFLILTPICVSLGLASVLLSEHGVTWGLFAVVLLGALMAHISVNALNEYMDFQSGLDFKTDRTPFSGGSGTLVIQPRLAPYALGIGVVSLFVTLICGIYLLQYVGWGLVPIGVLGILIIVTYTSWINRNRVLVLVAPGLGFGPLMVIGTYYALTAEYSSTALLLSMVPFFLVNNLLLLNQLPDVDADRSVGRDNFAIAWSTEKSAWLFLIFCILAYVMIIMGVLLGRLPFTALIGLLTAGIAYQVFKGIRAYRGEIKHLIPYLGKNVVLTLVTPLLIFLGILADIVII